MRAGTNNFVVIRQTVEFQIVQVQKDMMGFGHGMRVCMRIGAAALEVLATH